VIAWRTTENVDGREPLSAVDAEIWLLKVGQALLAAQTHDAARLAFNEATRETAGRLPYSYAGRALDLLEKRLRHLAEKSDRAHGAPP
jgi:hypothetical protein